jgi:hypothetical protein
MGGAKGHDVEVAESMQTVPTRAPCAGREAKGIAKTDNRSNINANNTLFKKAHVVFAGKNPRFRYITVYCKSGLM